MTTILEKITKKYPDVDSRVSIMLNRCGPQARQLAIKLFEAGFTVIVTDPDPSEVSALSKILFERSGSIYRYRTVSYESHHHMVASMFIELGPTEGEVLNAETRIVAWRPPDKNKQPPS